MKDDRSPLQDIIDKMNVRLNEESVTTAKLADIIAIAAACREGTIDVMKDGTILEENIPGAQHELKEFTKIIVTANHKAQLILGCPVSHVNLNTEIETALKEIEIYTN